MVKKYKMILSLLLVVLVCVGVITVTGVFDINKIVKEHEEKTDEALTARYQDAFLSMTDENSPLLKTDVENIYYAMDLEGDVRFYRVENGEFTQIEESGSFEVKAPCSGQELPAVIHYIELPERTIGYGLFTNTLYEGVYLYDYAFFKVTEMFPAFAGESSLLMLLDVDKTRFYSDDKVFSEAFYLYSDHTCKHFLNENQRIVDINARMRTDYKMFTSDILDQTGNVLFFSSRYYTAYEDSDQIDILTSGGTGENVDNVQYIIGIASLHMWETDGGVLYFSRNTGDGFTLKRFDGENHTDVKTFTGSLENDYLICGKYILNKASGEIYCVTDGSVKQLDYSRFRKDFTPDLFSISDNGIYCVIRGANNRNKPVIGMTDFVAGTMTDYEDDVFGFTAALHVQNDGTVIISTATGESASSYYQLVGVVGRTLDTFENAETETYNAAENVEG
jgi:hypothetical protein